MVRKIIYLVTALLWIGWCMGATIPPGLQYTHIKKHIPRQLKAPLKQAEKAIKRDNYYLADRYYKEIIEKEKNFYAYWGRAWTQRQMGNAPQAGSLYYQAFQMNDSTRGFLADYLDFVDDGAFRWELFARIVTAMYAHYRNDEALMAILEVSQQRRLYAKALRLLADFSENYPQQANVQVYYASLLSEVGEDLQAVEVAKRAAAIASDPFHLKLLVYIYANNGYFLEAASVCQRLSEIARRAPSTYEAWGYLEYKQGHYENAAYYYKKALRKDYRSATLIMLARLAHFYLVQPKEALYYAKAAVQIDRQAVDAYYILAECYRQKGNLDKALKYSQEQIELLPERPHPYYYQGKLYLAQKKYQQAIRRLEKAVELSPDVQRYRLVLAKAYAGAGNLEAAHRTYQNFINEPLQNLWEEEELLKETPPEPQEIE